MAVTEFFRTPNVWGPIDNAARAMRRPVAGRTLHVFSGGCASGHEAVSVAMLLADLAIPDFTVTAVDVDAELVDHARAGRYPYRELRRALREGVLDSRMTTRYFRRHGTDRQVHPDLAAHIDYQVADLNHPAGLIPEPCDIALVRNVWRHLTPEGRHALAAELHRLMPPHGVLVLGGGDFYDRHPNPASARALDQIMLRPEWTADVEARFTVHRHELVYRPRTTTRAGA